MATCPYCMGALTEDHRCRRGRLSRFGDAMLTILVGSGIGALLCYGIEERPTGPLIMATAALGAVLATAVRQAVVPRPRL
jgi:hypothetical protein